MRVGQTVALIDLGAPRTRPAISRSPTFGQHPTTLTNDAHSEQKRM